MIWIVLLYLVIGGVVAGIASVITDKDIHASAFFGMAVTWPFFILDLVLNILIGILTRIWALLAIFATTKIFWFLLLLTLILSGISRCNAHAGTITGEKALGGLSAVFSHKTEMWYDPEDLELLAQVLEHENYSNGERALYLTGAVVINRRNSPKWPNTIHDVVYQKGQYSTTGKFWSRPVHDKCYRIASWLLIFGCPDVPSDLVYQAMFPQGSGVYEFINTDYFCYE